MIAHEFHTLARLAALVLVAAVLGACARELKPDTPPGVSLAGTWKLNRQASDDPQAMLARMQEEASKHRRERMAGETDDDFPDDAQIDNGSASASRAGPPHAGMRGGGGFIQRAYARSLGGLLNGEALTIEQTSTRLVFAREDSRRSFTPGQHSVISVPDGVADQRSGWSGREYVIEVEPQVGPRVIERYGLSADTGQLVEKLRATVQGLPKLEFTRVYDRGTPDPSPLPTSN